MATQAARKGLVLSKTRTKNKMLRACVSRFSLHLLSPPHLFESAHALPSTLTIDFFHHQPGVQGVGELPLGGAVRVRVQPYQQKKDAVPEMVQNGTDGADSRHPAYEEHIGQTVGDAAWRASVVWLLRAGAGERGRVRGQGGRALPVPFASRSVRHALLTPYANPGSLYRCGRGT